MHKEMQLSVYNVHVASRFRYHEVTSQQMQSCGCDFKLVSMFQYSADLPFNPRSMHLDRYLYSIRNCNLFHHCSRILQLSRHKIGARCGEISGVRHDFHLTAETPDNFRRAEQCIFPRP